MSIFRITPNRDGSYLLYSITVLDFDTLAMFTPLNIPTGVFIDLRNINL